MKIPTDDLDFNFIENSLQLLGVRFRNCECCGKRILTQIPKLDRLCEDCFESQKKITKNFTKE